MTFFSSENLKVGYEKRIVVDGVNIDLNRGEILCLLGPNGCGKSTVLKTITDHIKRIDGSIAILGKELNTLCNKEMAKQMSVVLTNKVAPDMMTSEEIVATGRYPYTNYLGKLTDRDLKVIDESIRVVKGENLRYKEFRSLSDGEKQRIMIARAICQESDIMVLDEPTSFLDIRFKVELLNILRKLSLDRGKTIIMSLHEIDLVPKIADKVLLIKNGSVYKYGVPEDVITDKAIREAYNLNSGSFNVNIGNIELPKITQNPKVFVLGGEGKATKIYRVLNKRGVGFYSGILFKNDIDYNTSKTLAYETIEENCFVDIDSKKIENAKKYIKNCQVLIDSGVSLEGINRGNYDLLRFASKEGLKILSLREEDIGLNSIQYHLISTMINELMKYV